jgi:hypothetical protein
MSLANIHHFESVRAYWDLLETAEPNPRLWSFLRKNDVDCLHVFNLLHGAVAQREWDISGQKEDCILLPLMEEDAITPLDVVAFSMRDPSRFQTVLGIGTVLGAQELMNPATYWGGEPCRLVSSPLKWLSAGIEGCAVVLDPSRAKAILDWAPGDLAAMDESHADELVDAGAVDPTRLVVPLLRRAA